MLSFGSSGISSSVHSSVMFSTRRCRVASLVDKLEMVFEYLVKQASEPHFTVLD